MNLGDWITRLQNKPAHIRQRLALGLTLAAGLIVGVVWLAQIGQISFSKSDLPQFPINDALNATNRTKVEWAETTDDKIFIYFKISNETSDILNFPPAETIRLAADGQAAQPESITDRQRQPFVKKILSQTTAYGLMTFPKITSGRGELTIDEMSFENSPTTFIKEVIRINLEELSKPESTRL